jgi:hypothetical protein
LPKPPTNCSCNIKYTNGLFYIFHETCFNLLLHFCEIKNSQPVFIIDPGKFGHTKDKTKTKKTQTNDKKKNQQTKKEKRPRSKPKPKKQQHIKLKR